jgi:hypothetical protein
MENFTDAPPTGDVVNVLAHSQGWSRTPIYSLDIILVGHPKRNNVTIIDSNFTLLRSILLFEEFDPSSE